MLIVGKLCVENGDLWREDMYENSLYFMLNFSINLKFKNLLILKSCNFILFHLLYISSLNLGNSHSVLYKKEHSHFKFWWENPNPDMD